MVRTKATPQGLAVIPFFRRKKCEIRTFHFHFGQKLRKISDFRAKTAKFALCDFKKRMVCTPGRKPASACGANQKPSYQAFESIRAQAGNGENIVSSVRDHMKSFSQLLGVVVLRWKHVTRAKINRMNRRKGLRQNS